MATKVGELFVDLVVDAASGNLSVRQLVSALGELDVASATSVGIIGKVAETLIHMAMAATNTAVEMQTLSEVTGADPKMVQQWEKAAERIDIHTGSIIKSIQGVNNMMGAIAARKSSPPMELTSWLGITPQKGLDLQGRPIMKTFFDMMGELANKNSRYWTYTPQVQQQILGGAFPGSNPQDLFRILNEMRAGRFRPQDISVLEDKQVKELTDVRREETKLGQQLTGIFDKLILGGDGFARVLESVSQKLDAIDKWLAGKKGQESIGIVGREAASIIRNKGNPWLMGLDAGKFLAEEFGLRPSVRPLAQAAPQIKDLEGKLDINITGPGGVPLGRRELFLRRKVSNVDVEHVTINAGNGGLGQ